MMTNRNEIESDKHLDMGFIEFLEALSRCADKFNLNYLKNEFPEYKSQNPYQLDTKLQAVIFKLLKVNLSPKQYEQAV